MSITINGNGTITGYEPVPNGSITSAKLATGAGGKILQYKTSKRNTGNTEVTSTGYQEIHSDLRITLTPIASDSTIHVLAYIYCSQNSSKQTTFRMRRNTASDFSGTSTEVLEGSAADGNDDGICSLFGGGDYQMVVPVVVYETSGNTTARTYSPLYRNKGDTTYVNRRSGGEYHGLSTMTVIEIAA